MAAIMYALGSNGSGQLGIGHKEDVSVPREVLLDSGIPISASVVKAGGNHTLLLSAGILYCAGNYTSGACGILDGALLESKFCPVRLTDAKNSILNRAPIMFCAATWEASIIVVQDDSGCAKKLYSFGTGLKGELGQGELLFRSANAQFFEDFPPPGLEVRDLAASVAHVVAVLSNGDVYGWGNGRKGQLGVPAGIIYKPRKIVALDFKVVRATCGREFTCLLGESETGNLVVMGSDKWGVISSAPKIIPRWTDADASWGSIHLLLQDGNVMSWGRGDHGQLAPFGLPRLVKIAIGSEHALGLTTDGRVLAWGWGEHGNCGPSTADGDVREKWNTIALSQYLTPGSKIFSIGAGYSTSWICVKTFGN